MLIFVQLVNHTIDIGAFGFDFQGTVWEGGRAVLDGRTPYPPATVEAMEVGNPFVYPPVVLWLGVPLAWLPLDGAELLWTLVLGGGVLAAMLILGVRDWRCVGIAVLSVPVMQGLTMGNITLLLLPGLALAWRYRDRSWLGGTAVGLLIALKLFLWPLVVWLVVTRRFRAAAVAAAVAAGAVLGSWALIGFDGLLEYPALLRVLTEVHGFDYISVSALSESLGASEQLAHAAQYVTGGALLAIGVLLARYPQGDERTFSGLVIAALVLSPVTWAWNFALLFVLIAIRQPRFGALWLGAWAAFWFEALVLRDPLALGNGDPAAGRTLVILGLVAAVFLATAGTVGNRGALARRRLLPSS